MTRQERHDLIVDHYQWAKFSARAFFLARCGIPDLVEDAESNGLVGLVKAADGFDPGRGASFKTYAGIRIRGAVLDGLRDHDYLSKQYRRQVKRSEFEFSRCTLEAFVYTEDGRPLKNSGHMVDKSIGDPREAYVAYEAGEIIKKLLYGLKDPKAIRCIECYYFKDQSMKEIGSLIGVSESRVSQIVTKNLSILKKRFDILPQAVV
jgi:RNA polymerase sigma factor for flagellar operon FliA